MREATRTLTVRRYNPERGVTPYTQDYEIPVWDGMMVLDALNFVKENVDSTLAFRWSCRMGVCGSCGMSVSGSPRLTCQDSIAEYDGRDLVVSPLANFPVIRDLVVDIGDFMNNKLPTIKPWLIRREKKPLSEGEYLQTPAQRAVYDHHASCINCMLCYSACPVYGMDPRFKGPAALAIARRYNTDSRDQGTPERVPILNNPEAVWACTFIGECSVVCPKGVQPAEAIQRSKLQVATRFALGKLASGGKK